MKASQNRPEQCTESMGLRPNGKCAGSYPHRHLELLRWYKKLMEIKTDALKGLYIFVYIKLSSSELQLSYRAQRTLHAFGFATLR